MPYRRSLAALALTAVCLMGASALAQNISQYDPGRYPDWSGPRQRVGQGGNRYDYSKPPGLAQQAPLTAEYQALFEAGLKDHDRWLTAKNLLARKLAGRRSTSSLQALLDYVLARPIVSAGMIAKELKITPRAAQDLVGELGLREATGRRRYRAWGIF